MLFRKISLLVILTSLFAGDLPASEQDETVLKAMRDEINRSISELKLDKLKKPYYIEYTISFQSSHSVKASLGYLDESNTNNTARLTAGVRVGNYKFDNSNFFDIGLSFFGSGDDEESFKGRRIPYNPDYKSLRRELWLATDAAYKQSAEILSKKEATIKNRMRKDTTHDFLRVPAEKNYISTVIPAYNKADAEGMCKKVSSVFRKYPEIITSTIGLEYIPQTIYYVNSEGMEYIKTELYTGFEVLAVTQADDGMPLANLFSAYSGSPDGLPALDSLIKAAEATASKLSRLRSAEVLDEAYSGPIVFSGQAASELFAQVFAPNLVAQRSPMTENGMQDDGRYSAFQTKIGGRVLPEFISVSALPGEKLFMGTPLSGYELIDDDGIKSRKTVLVKDGYLKNLLSSRVPTKRVRNSNGHKRGGAPMLSNIFVSVGNDYTRTYEDLKKKMIELCEARELPFGIVVKKVMNQNIMYTTMFRLAYGTYPTVSGGKKIQVLEAYKVFPDGREELVRGLEANGFTVQSFKDILLAGNTKYAMNYLAPAVVSPFVSGGSQYVSSSIIIPDLLFEDGEIKPVEEDYPKPPILTNPIK